MFRKFPRRGWKYRESNERQNVMDNENTGSIVSIRGDVIEVSFSKLNPNPLELIAFVDDQGENLEV